MGPQSICLPPACGRRAAEPLRLELYCGVPIGRGSDPRFHAEASAPGHRAGHLTCRRSTGKEYQQHDRGTYRGFDHHRPCFLRVTLFALLASPKCETFAADYFCGASCYFSGASCNAVYAATAAVASAHRSFAARRTAGSEIDRVIQPNRSRAWCRTLSSRSNSRSEFDISLCPALNDHPSSHCTSAAFRLLARQQFSNEQTFCFKPFLGKFLAIVFERRLLKKSPHVRLILFLRRDALKYLGALSAQFGTPSPDQRRGPLRNCHNCKLWRRQHCRQKVDSSLAGRRL